MAKTGVKCNSCGKLFEVDDDKEKMPYCCDKQQLVEVMAIPLQNVNSLLANNLKDLYIPANLYNNNNIKINQSSNISDSLIVFEVKCHQNDIFLTVFDSCQAFTSQIEMKEIKRIFRGIRTYMILNKPTSQLEIFEPRGLHHIFLLVDGFCKMRCLFNDHNPDFIATKEDYDSAEKLMHNIINTWSTVL
jgi:hypothetical protein